MDNFFLGLSLGIVFALLMWISLDYISNIEARPEGKNIVWISKDDDLTCRKNDNYPQLNCQLIKEAIGPKLVEKPEIVIEENNE